MTDLGEFVDEFVEVNGEAQGLQRYTEGLGAIVAAVPDFHWDVRHLLVDGCWLSAHIDTGTDVTGRPLSTPEFAFYRVSDGRIVAVWGGLELDRLRTN